METGIIIVFLFLHLVARVSASDSLLSPKGVNYEVAALMSIKIKMVDRYHVLEGWDINSVDPCTWNMVACSQEGYVISLEMVGVGLSGPLSPSIGNLTHLRTMLLQNNQLFGYIPYEIGKLRELQTLDLSGNQFGGEIPSSLGYLTHLSYMRLSRNRLSGVIPKPIADLSGLSFLDLSFNDLSGPTPKILAKGFSVAGNIFLCSSVSAEICSDAPKSVNDTSPFKSISKHHHRWLLPVILGVSCTFVVSVTLLACWVHWCRSRLLHTSHVQQDYEFDISHLKRFTFRELQNATNNFSSKNVLGRGGFGVVYKGYLPNNVMVAVKRLLDPNFTGEVQFQTEVEMIGLALHRNLLRLYGFCMTPEERMLVYPYMPNGSVADRLRDNGREPSLDWRKRMRIAVGAARGLLYLHEQCNPKIIHRDVKAANILLDESFGAVVGDFGLAKLLDRRDSHVTTAVRGTIGHIAPEYLSTGQSSEKTDVFGYGILLLELITGGQKAINIGNGLLQKGMILDWVKTLQQEKRLEVLVDRDLKGCFITEELAKVVEIALQCTQSNPMQRPKMSEVLPIVEAIAEGQPFHFVESHVAVAGNMGNMCPDHRAFSFSRNLNDGYEESSFTIEAIELSGPR